MRTAVLLTALAVSLLTAGPGMAADGETTACERWPCEAVSGDVTFKMYQPQVDSWDGYTLKAHSAVAAQKKGNAERVSYGVASISANTITDRENRFVRFENLRVESVRFPSEPGSEQAYLAGLRSSVPRELAGMSLDRLEENLAVLGEQKKGQTVRLRNSPPKIIFSQVPAVLVFIDGDPVFSPVANTSLSRVVNTQVLLLKDASGKLYLHVFDGYLEAPSLSGPWTIAPKPPAGGAEAERIAENNPQTDLLAGEPDPSTGRRPSLTLDRAPVVHVSREYAELVVTGGEPEYVPIAGTNLLYVTNTTANVFKDLDDQMVYVLISGRWFRAPAENGPWRYVPGTGLPRDFAAIPDGSVKENVKASVPGTTQAQEAAISNGIPTMSRVDRGEKTLPLVVDGEPELRPVEGTPLRYVFNSSLPLIRIDARTWYAVSGGVWYTAPAVGGPWTVAASVPPVIYSIPPSSPLYYVTFVKVYNAAPGYVDVGYTPGYFGSFVGPEGTIVYGTGYFYPVYASPRVWFSPPLTYGYGCSPRWTPWYGWSFGFGFGWGPANLWCYPPAPFWGPFFHQEIAFHQPLPSWGLSTSINVYHHAIPPQMQSLQFGQAYNSRTGVRVVGHGTSIPNVYRGAAIPSPRVQPPSGGVPHAAPAPSPPPSSTVPHGTSPQGAPPSAGVYGTREGNVYSYEPQNGGWRHLNPPGAVPGPRAAPAPQPPPGTPVPDTLDKERAARELGNARARSFQSYQQQGAGQAPAAPGAAPSPGPAPSGVPHMGVPGGKRR